MNTTNTNNSDATARGGFNRSTYVAMENSLNAQHAATSSLTSASSASASHNISPSTGASFAESMERVKNLRDNLSTWTGKVCIDVAESLTSDTIIEIDIMETIDNATKKVPSASKRRDENCYWLLKQFYDKNDDDTRNQIFATLHNACRMGGFKVKCRYQENSSCTTAAKTGWIEARCNRCEFHDEEKNKAHNMKKKSNLNTKTKANEKKKRLAKEKRKRSGKPVKGLHELCPVCFKIYWDVMLQRWFVPKHQKGEKIHCGHKQRKPSDIRLDIKYVVTPDDEELAKHVSNTFVATTALKSILEQRNPKYIGMHWQQIHHMKRKQMEQCEGKHKTSVDHLLHYVSSEEDISWIGLFADPKTSLLTVKKQKSKKNSALTVEQLSNDLLGDVTDNPSQYVAAMRTREQLIHTETGQLMIALAFTSDTQRMLFDKCKCTLVTLISLTITIFSQQLGCYSS